MSKAENYLREFRSILEDLKKLSASPKPQDEGEHQAIKIELQKLRTERAKNRADLEDLLKEIEPMIGGQNA